MSDDDTKIKFKNEMQRDEAIVYFTALVDGLKRGALELQQGSECLLLAPNRTLQVEIKAERKKNKERFAFELSWKRPKSAKSESAKSKSAKSKSAKPEPARPEPGPSAPQPESSSSGTDTASPSSD